MLRKTAYLTVIVLIISFTAYSVITASKQERGDKNHWKNGMFRQDSVNISGVSDGIIKARIDGAWKEYKIRTLSKGFIKWNLESRMKMISGKGMPSLAGAHNSMFATYGAKRLDSQVSVNNAVKSTGLAPKKEKIDGMLKKIKDTWESAQEEKLEVLKSFYKNEDNYDFTKLVSLDIVTNEDFESHTFLNLMENPVSAVLYLDWQCYELKAIVRLVHPKDDKIEEYEKKLLEWTNLIHNYYHTGKQEIKYIGIICYIIEEYDNSPSKNGWGRRITPELGK